MLPNSIHPVTLVTKNCPRSRIEVKPTALLSYHAHNRMALTFDLNLFNPTLAIVMTHIHTKTPVQRSVGSKDIVEQTGRRTDRRTPPIALHSRLTRSVKIPQALNCFIIRISGIIQDLLLTTKFSLSCKTH